MVQRLGALTDLAKDSSSDPRFTSQAKPVCQVIQWYQCNCILSSHPYIWWCGEDMYMTSGLGKCASLRKAIGDIT